MRNKLAEVPNLVLPSESSNNFNFECSIVLSVVILLALVYAEMVKDGYGKSFI